MSSNFRPDYVEYALVQLLQANLPAAYGAELGTSGPSAVDIAPLGENDFDDQGQLVLTPPSVRVRFVGGKYDPARDNQRLTYQSHPQWEILSFESSLASKADERSQTLILVAAVTDQLAGARLLLQDGTKTFPISILSVELLEGPGAGVDQLFALRIEVEGFAQFSGANANPN